MHDENYEAWRNWLGLRHVRGIGPVIYQGLLRAFGDPARVFATGVSGLECAGVREDLARAIRGFDEWDFIDAQLRRMRSCEARLITWNDDEYPTLLRQIHDPPPFLMAIGNVVPADAQAVAIVGSRGPTGYAIRMARELAEALAALGITVVSGLARGTDAAAHWGAIRGNGRTLSVLGSGVDVIYPPEHRALARAVQASGALLSELPMGAPPDAENFPARNRIVSGLSLGTVVVEAAEKSGSLITAIMAVEQGREVFAVPGAVSERSRGGHRLLRNGAKLTESVEDILEEIFPQLVRKRPVAVSPQLTLNEAAVMAEISNETVHIDTILGRCRLATPEVLEALLGLELKGVVEQLPGKHFTVSKVDAVASLAKN